MIRAGSRPTAVAGVLRTIAAALATGVFATADLTACASDAPIPIDAGTVYDAATIDGAALVDSGRPD